ncbi:PIN domain-like protein, partial [Ramicandelaber brevisporus]
MGVQGLWPLLEPASRPVPDLDSLRGKRLAVDASIWLHQFIRAIHGPDGQPAKGAHVVGFFRRLCKLMHYRIKPVLVFDGGAPELKRRTLADRKKSRQNAERNAATIAGKLYSVRRQAQADVARLEQVQRQALKAIGDVSTQMTEEVQTLLRLCGIPYIVAPMEAEAQCAKLLQLGLVDGIVTDDSDVFLFGGDQVYRNLFHSKKHCEHYRATDLERELQFTRERLISLAQILGSDYTVGIRGAGAVLAMEILAVFGDSSAEDAEGGLKSFAEWW